MTTRCGRPTFSIHVNRPKPATGPADVTNAIDAERARFAKQYAAHQERMAEIESRLRSAKERLAAATMNTRPWSYDERRAAVMARVRAYRVDVRSKVPPAVQRAKAGRDAARALRTVGRNAPEAS